MKRSAYIHIGLPKTGTTAIQITLGKLFRENKLAEFDMQFHHSDIGEYIRDFWYTKDEAYFTEQLHKSILKFGTLGGNNVIISNECLASAFLSNNWGFKYDLLPVLASALRDYNIKLIVYIRRQDIYIESNVNQRAKSAYNAQYERADFYYKALLDNCVKYFGRENLIVRKYEREDLYGSDVVVDFLHIVGLDKLIPNYLNRTDNIVNSSLSPSSLRVAMADNQRYLLSETEREARIKYIETQYKNGAIPRAVYTSLANDYLRGYDNNRLPMESRIKRAKILSKNSNFSFNSGNTNLFTTEERRAILEKYAEDNAAVAREYFDKEDGVLFNDKMPTSVVVENNELTATDIVQVFMPIYNRANEKSHFH